MFSAKNIRVQIGAKMILDGVSLEINSGEVVALLKAMCGDVINRTRIIEKLIRGGFEPT